MLENNYCGPEDWYEYKGINTVELIARLPRLFRTRYSVPGKNPIAADFGINKGDCLFYIENGILCVLIRIAIIEKISVLRLLTWRYD